MSGDPEFRFGNPQLRRRKSRLWPWLALVMLALAGLATYWYFNPESQPGFVSGHLPSNPAAEITLYRWQDENGEWVVSDQPPPEGVDYQEVNYRQDTNVLPPPDRQED